MSNKPTICLNMIVKDEEHIILRCLESVKDVIDYWVICDTGSSDKTCEIIKAFFKKENIPGELHLHKWENFSHNRNLSLELTKKKSDYIFIIDADDQFIHKDNFKFQNLTYDSYHLYFKMNTITFTRTALIKSSKPWKWVGVLHEYLECKEKFHSDIYPEGHIIASTEGARGKNPDRFKADIKTLKAALKETPENTRDQFYLAQSYRDDKDFSNALEAYKQRVKMGGWEEEIYYSLFEIGKCELELGCDKNQVLESLLKAYYYRPSRLEALSLAVRISRQTGNYHLGYHLGIASINKPQPNDRLFISSGVYEWELKDEVSICASWIGHKVESRKLINDILKLDHLSIKTVERLKNNLTFC